MKKEIEVAAQNVFDRPNGAFTGEISTEQLKDSDIAWSLVGHSERRVILGEDDNVSVFPKCREGCLRVDEESEEEVQWCRIWLERGVEVAWIRSRGYWRNYGGQAQGPACFEPRPALNGDKQAML